MSGASALGYDKCHVVPAWSSNGKSALILPDNGTGVDGVIGYR